MPETIVIRLGWIKPRALLFNIFTQIAGSESRVALVFNFGIDIQST
jgi:hypothetical protein